MHQHLFGKSVVEQWLLVYWKLSLHPCLTSLHGQTKSKTVEYSGYFSSGIHLFVEKTVGDEIIASAMAIVGTCVFASTLHEVQREECRPVWRFDSCSCRERTRSINIVRCLGALCFEYSCIIQKSAETCINFWISRVILTLCKFWYYFITDFR